MLFSFTVYTSSNTISFKAYKCALYKRSRLIVSAWIVKEMDRTLAGVSVATYLRLVMSRVLRIC